MNAQLLHGDCLERLKELPDNSVDAVVTDPPYGLSFMGKKWDYDVPSEDVWRECLRVLKPGGHLLAFAGTRTQHRMAVRIEDAGFEIRDMIAWVYSTGFPKSLDVSKAIDKAAGAEREVVGTRSGAINNAEYSQAVSFVKGSVGYRPDFAITAPATPEAQRWQGWGTALKPALEPITVARKPLAGTVAENVLLHGTGALNIDGCRVAHGDDVDLSAVQRQQAEGTGIAVGKGFVGSILGKEIPMYKPGGRWPANLIHDGSEEVVGLFPDTGKSTGGRTVKRSGGGNVGSGKASESQWSNDDPGYGDTGSAARFFYCAKASKRDRDEGCEGLPHGAPPASARSNPAEGRQNALGSPRSNHHPTVKPTDLMRYLCRLVTPPGGTVLDPFMGSGSTGKAAMLEGFQFIGIERESEYLEIAKARIEHAAKSVDPQLDMPGMV